MVIAPPVCPRCSRPLFFVMTKEKLCRPCRAQSCGVRTAEDFLRPVPYGKVCVECMGCGGPALLTQILQPVSYDFALISESYYTNKYQIFYYYNSSSSSSSMSSHQ